jgi:hypothetical protein
MLNRYDRQFELLPDWWAARKRLCLLSVVVVLMTSVASGVEQRTHSNTPWAIAAPRDAGGQAALDLQQRMILDTIFPAHAPLLTKPAAPPPDQAPATAPDIKRVAVRPDGVDGWRPASVPISPLEDSRQVNPSGPGPSPETAILPHEQPVAQAPAPEPANESGRTGTDATRPPISVQFRAPRLARPVPVPADPATDHNQKDDVASEFDVEGVVPEPNVGVKSPELSKSPTASIAGPAIITPTDNQIAESPIADSQSTDTTAGNDLSADMTPVGSAGNDALESARSDEGPKLSRPAAVATGPLESLESVDAAPTDSSDQSPGEGSASESTEPAAPVVEPPPPLTRQLVNLRSRVRSVLNGYYRKSLNSREHDPWEVMHGMLAYGVKSRVHQGGPRGELITSVGWLCYNKPCKGLTMMHVTRDGELRAKYGVGLQGHLGQLLAMLAQCHVSADYPIRVGKHEFTIHDLIEAEKKTCYPKSELTFKLLAFQYYLDLNEKWVNDQGLQWDFPRLIREELAQPIRGAACGGTHRLSSLSLTVKARVRRSEPLDGEYARAAEFVQKYHQYAFRLQNRDGSLSTAWFNGRGDESDINRRIKTTGHILEWLCYSLSDEELRDQRTIRAVTYLANLMYSNYNNEWEVGPMCHATHALLLYDERVFQPHDRPGYAAPYRPKPATAVRAPQGTRR